MIKMILQIRYTERAAIGVVFSIAESVARVLRSRMDETDENLIWHSLRRTDGVRASPFTGLTQLIRTVCVGSQTDIGVFLSSI
jgi:hypothetical protein